MALHHRHDMNDIRTAYVAERSYHSDQDSELRSCHTSRTGSDKSYQTQPTQYSNPSVKRPARIHYNSHNADSDSRSRYFVDRAPQESPRSSVDTYASTIASEEDPAEEIPDYDVPDYSAQRYGPAAIAATPADFSELFPSQRRLAIRHDDSTLDGNMNLRVDTEVNMHGRRRDMTLFHLRMHDLRDREFSLRRYCRDSGREVCHSSRKVQKGLLKKRPGFQRSLSNALSNMRTKSDQKIPTLSSLKRNDSGYGSISSSIDFDKDARPSSASAYPKAQQQADPNGIQLEFSNYAHVDIKRTGVKGSKRYDWEYWGIHYSWKRIIRKTGGTKSVSYQLTKTGSDRPLAHIIPSALTSTELEEETKLGGWVPPCTMYIADESLVGGQKDVADVVVATGLMALVDDSIKTHFQSSTKQLLIPIPKLQVGVEYIGPKRLINEMFRREGSGNHSRQSSTSRPSSSAGASGTRAVKSL